MADKHTTPTAAQQIVCVMCNQPGTKRCGRCLDARYCSTECQKADWTLHKPLCKHFAMFKDANRPSAAHFRAIVLPENEDSPKFVRVKTKPCGRNNKYGLDKTQRGEILGAEFGISMRPYEINHALQRPIGYTFRLRCREYFLEDGSRPNPTIDKWKIASGGCWCGPFLAYGTKDKEDMFCDLDTTALTKVREFLLWENRDGVPETFANLRPIGGKPTGGHRVITLPPGYRT